MDSSRNAFSARGGFFPLEPVSAARAVRKARHSLATRRGGEGGAVDRNPRQGADARARRSV